MARARAERPKMSLSCRSGNWCIQFWDGARSRRISCRTTDEAAARRFLAAYEAGYHAPAPPETPTIGMILDGYLQDRKDAGVAAPSTLAFACAALKRHLGDLEPGLLTKERTRFYRARRRAEGHMVGPQEARRKKPTSDGTILKELSTLRAAFAWAVAAGWIATAPHVELPSQPAPRDRALDRDEVTRLLAGCREFHILAFAVLAVTTGARSGAIMGLRTASVDFASGTIDFGEGRGNKRRNRACPIHPDALPVLHQAIELSTKGFVIEYAGEPVKSVKTGFAAACRRAGLSGVTPHVMKHTAATWLAAADVPIWKAAGLLRTTTATLERVYAKHSPTFLRDAVAAIGRIEAPVLSGRRKKA